jgi:hypothetical protein
MGIPIHWKLGNLHGSRGKTDSNKQISKRMSVKPHFNVPKGKVTIIMRKNDACLVKQTSFT